MATIVKNLFPPIMPDVIPAFIRTESCKIYFSLSSYDNVADIKNVQITLVNQKTNASAFNINNYPSGIKLTDLNLDETVQDNYKYYVQINTADLIDNEFGLNQFYKVQLRFTSVEADDPPAEGGIATWLAENIDYFSEWSTVCLIKGIEQPKILIEGLDQDETNILLFPLTNIIGKLYYDNSEETEYLKSYNIKIYESNSNKLIYNTDQIYADEYKLNEITCEIKYNLLKEINYTLVFSYTTNNLYHNSVFYLFNITKETNNILDADVTITPEENNGRIKIDINFDFESFTGTKTDKNLIIKRASFKTNFNIWESVKTIPHDINSIRHIWYDNTIESGVWYKYRIQEQTYDNTGKIFQYKQPIMCVFEDMFLTCGDKQLKIKFNPTLTDYKYNLLESQQTTLGSKFPFIKRNGNTFYRTFNIGGLITAFIDKDDWYNPHYFNNKFHTLEQKETFTSSFEVYQESKELYDKYNFENAIDDYQNELYEREFREKVLDFLYENNIKLFRSTQEGNVLVKLMSIAFQPVTQLNRRLYSFTAAAIEMDDCNIANYIKYKLINKYYYYYKISSISEEFKEQESIIQKILSNSLKNVQQLKIFKLKIKINNNQDNVVFYVKTKSDKEYLKYTVSSSEDLQLEFLDDEPVEDCYFYGIHLNDNQYTITDEYYFDVNEIQNPIENGVYYISNDDQLAVRHYVSYNKYKRLLTTEENEVSIDDNSDYSLFMENEYKKYIYYNNTWYPFSDDGNVLMNINATIDYYYEVKEEN